MYLEVGRTCVPSVGEGPVFLQEGKGLCFKKRGRTFVSRGGEEPVFLEEGKDLCF